MEHGEFSCQSWMIEKFKVVASHEKSFQNQRSDLKITIRPDGLADIKVVSLESVYS